MFVKINPMPLQCLAHAVHLSLRKILKTKPKMLKNLYMSFFIEVGGGITIILIDREMTV